MLDRLSIPRRTLDFEDYVDILRRNVRWIIGPAFAGLVIATFVAYLMEDTYVSTALIRIVPQQIATDMISTVTTQDVSDRINGMAQQIKSRGTLTTLINEFGLYKAELKHEPMSDVIETMQENLKILPVMGLTNVQQTRSLPAMQIQFAYRDRFLANKVCRDIVSRFTNASAEDSLSSQVATNSFMKDEFERAQRTLQEAERKLQTYRMKNAGRLPDDMQTNIQQMNALGQRMSSLSDAATRNSERRMMMDSNLRIAKDRLTALKSSGAAGGSRNERTIQLDKDIQDLQSSIANMKDRYTEDYPDLQSARDRLATLKRQRDDAVKAAADAKPDTTPESPTLARERQEAQAAVQQIQTSLKAAALEDEQTTRALAAVNAELRNYQSKVEQAPAGEMEYAGLIHDQLLAKQKYDDMENKLHRSSLSMDLERHKQGETLELLDDASLPTEATAPKRAMIIPVGLVGGLLLGVLIVALREVRDTSLKNLKDARLYTQLSILGSIPLLENDVVVQRRKQVMWVGWATATVFGLVVIAGSVAHYYLTKA
ncbi:MAG TPA: Wzz/FepE/Etk N-terminal domain-containing protein [Bryobacteraceae bacterium]